MKKTAWMGTHDISYNGAYLYKIKTLKLARITLIQSLHINAKDAWIGTHNIGYNAANKYKKTLQLAHIILLITPHIAYKYKKTILKMAHITINNKNNYINNIITLQQWK